MRAFDWLSEYLAQLQDEHVLVRHGSAVRLRPTHILDIDAEDWGQCARLAQTFGLRWCAGWGDHLADNIVLYACFEINGDYLTLRTSVNAATPVIPSHTPYYPAADRPERHTQDMLGVLFTDHADHRRWIRHRAWEEGFFPLRHTTSPAGEPAEQTPPDNAYPFHSARGAGVYEIPVGPVHAGIIEPGHFRFNAVGERVLSLEQHLGYVHKGIEKLAVGRDPASLVRLAARVSGDATVSHAWAACMALENAAACHIPARASELRALMSERERIANHLGDIGAICNDVGFGFALYQSSRLRERWQQRSAELFGHRFMMDTLIPGGVNRDIDANAIARLKADHAELRREIEPLFELLEDTPSLEDRLLSTGYLSTNTARSFGCTGYVGKASGQAFDVRKHHPYAPYDRLPMEPPCLDAGDVMARMQVRMQEVKISLDWMDRLLETLSDTPIAAEFNAAAGEGFGVVDSWRGETMAYVRLDGDGKVARYFPRDPSWQTWPALERIVLGNIVPDFPVCNKSVNGSYSGQDL